MTRVKVAPPTATVELSQQELVMIVNALNEVCNGFEITEFSTRIGADRQAAERLLAAVRDVAKGVVEK